MLAKPAEIKKLREIFYGEQSQDKEDTLFDVFVAEILEENKKKGIKMGKKEVNKLAREKSFYPGYQ